MANRFVSQFAYGFQKEPKIRHLVYSFILTSLYFLGVGIPVMFGYVMKIARRISVDQNRKSPPGYRPFKPLVKDGIIFLLYAIILIGIPSSGVFVSDMIISENLSSGALSTTDVAILNGVALGLFITAICGTFLLPAMISAIIVKDDWQAGFDFSLLESIIMSKRYLKLYLKFMILSAIFGLLVQFLINLLVTAPIGILLWFVYLVTIGRLLGEMCSYLKQKDLDTS